MNRRVGVVATIGPFNAGKDRLQRVVIVLADRVEFMIVATGTLHGHPADVVDHRRQHVVAVQVPCNLAIQRVFSNVAQRTFIPRARRKETKRHDC